MVLRKTKFHDTDFTYIPGGLQVGSNIIVRGRVPEGLDKFSLNLTKDKHDGSDIIFHFNPRVPIKTVVRNTYHGHWQEEEREIPSFPFFHGAKFTMKINVGPQSYSVMVDGQFFIQYNHRLPPQEAKYLRLDGAEYYEATIQNPSLLPFQAEIVDGLKPGKAVRVRGVVNENASRFSICFNADPEGHTVGILFNPRQDQDDVVLNTKVGDWQHEERGQGWFPFKKGHFFDVLFVAWDGKMNIYVEEKFFTSYNFRTPSDDIRYLEINGDVTIMDVELIDPLPGDYFKAVPSGLENGDLVIVKGFFYPEGQRFAIDLLNGSSHDDDIALHINPRRDQGEVVLCSREGGSWNKEQKTSLPRPFAEMLPFEVEIISESGKFRIFVNGKKLDSYKAKGSVENIKSINVSGQAHIYEVKLLRTVDRPFINSLPGALQPGSWVSVIGTPNKKGETLAVNLQCGSQPDYGCDVALCLLANLKTEEVTAKTQEGGSWVNKQKEKANFPFHPEDKFEILILRSADMFQVFINSKHFMNYSHKIDPSRISHIMLTGDCTFFEPEFFNLQYSN
ncbi:Galectin-4 [Bulinus truncatus]|nr:Galectin-4 [Bulinus truncatus]